MLKLTTVFLLVSFFIKLAQSARKRKPVLKDGLFDGHVFEPVEEFTDEFRGRFDHNKWYDNNPRWKGRQPGLFASKNVIQRGRKLLLKGRYEGKGSDAFESAPAGYQDYTTSFVMTKKLARYGYLETKAKPGNSRLSSAFWGSLDTPKLWTEIDIFEIGGGAINDNGVDYRRLVNMNLHVFRNSKKGIKPGVNEISKPTYYRHSSFLRSRFNIYGLDWSKKWITWTFNGRAIRRDRNRWWKQAFPIKFDVETMPNWFGLPSKETLPATYKIKYLRTWKRTVPSGISKDVSITTRKVQNSHLSDRFLQTLHPGFGSINNVAGNNDQENDSTKMEDAEDTDDSDVDDNSITEVLSNTETETNAPVDGLQRPPIPGSNEAVYRPVQPPRGRTWSDVINYQNSVLTDVFGAQIQPEENINLDDFDEELLFFSNNNGAQKTPSPSAVEDSPREPSHNTADPQGSFFFSGIQNPSKGFGPSFLNN